MTTDSAPRRPRRATIVGAGLMGKWHAHAVSHAGHSVVAVVDSSIERASTLARAHAGASAFASLGASPLVDVVHICTPLPSHVPLALEAISRGADVIIEKPLASTPAETATVLDSAAAAGVLVVPVHQFVFQQGVRDAIASLWSIAPILHVDFTACTAGASGKSSDEQDRVALEVLPHPISLLARFEPDRVGAMEWTVVHTRPGELRATGVLGTSSVSVVISTGGRPTTNQMRIIGEGGTISIDLYHGFSTLTRGRSTRAGKMTQPFINASAQFGAAAANLMKRAVTREPAYPGLRELVRAFYHAAPGGIAAPISRQEILDVANAVANVQAMMKPR